MINHNDSLRNLVSGMGDPSRDKAANAYYCASTITDDQLTNAYDTSWLARKVVDVVAHDALRHWRDWQAPAEMITAIEAEEGRVGVRRHILTGLIRARLYGGSAVYIGISGQRPEEPLDPASIGRGGLSYLVPLSRSDIQSGPLDLDPLSPHYGTPESYSVRGVTVHPSRLVVQHGAVPADPTLRADGWGDSVLRTTMSAVMDADSVTRNIASLVFEANVDVFRIPDLMASVAVPSYRTKLIERFGLANVSKSVNRALLLDKEEGYDRRQITFSGLPEIVNQFLAIVAAAADVPITRMLGQSPGGLSSTGDADLQNYHDALSGIQHLCVTPAMTVLDEVLVRSALGEYPDGVHYLWAPFTSPSAQERATIGKTNADTAVALASTGLLTPEELRGAVINQMVECGVYPGLDVDGD